MISITLRQIARLLIGLLKWLSMRTSYQQKLPYVLFSVRRGVLYFGLAVGVERT